MSRIKKMIDESKVHHKSRPPLRWIANLAGTIASSGLLEISYMQDEGLENTFRYKFHGWKWDTFWPLYNKYGTTYEWDMSGEAWNDYDENGIPYWEKTGIVDPEFDPDLAPCDICTNCDDEKHCPGCMDCDNDYFDIWTGDAFRVIKRQ